MKEHFKQFFAQWLLWQNIDPVSFDICYLVLCQWWLLKLSYSNMTLVWKSHKFLLALVGCEYTIVSLWKSLHFIIRKLYNFFLNCEEIIYSCWGFEMGNLWGKQGFTECLKCNSKQNNSTLPSQNFYSARTEENKSTDQNSSKLAWMLWKEQAWAEIGNIGISSWQRVPGRAFLSRWQLRE